MAGARNVGLMESSGEYVTFLDDDDLRLPGSIDLQMEALSANPDAGFVCGGVIMADQNYEYTGEIVFPKKSGDVFWQILELEFPVMGLSTLIRKACFLRAGLFNRQLPGIDDWRIAELYPVLVINQPVGVYREPTWNSGQGSSARAYQLRRAVSHQLKLLRLPRASEAPLAERHAIRRRMINRVADTLLWNAARRIPNGEFRPALANIGVALRLNPLRALRPGAYKTLAETLFLRIQVPGT